MLKQFDEVSNMILEGTPMQIAGSADLLKKLPKGNWIGGSIEYFMTDKGGLISDTMLYVDTFDGIDFKINAYDKISIKNVAADAFAHGFSIVIMPYFSPVLKVYAEKAHEFEDMFIKHIVGWVSGINTTKPNQTPIVINGQTGNSDLNQAVVLHLALPSERNVNVGIINIFTPDENSPVIEFESDGFQIDKCLIDGKEAVLSDYMKEHNIDKKFPLIGDYAGNGINVAFSAADSDSLQLASPVFRNIKYRFANTITDYANEFNLQLAKFKGIKPIFSCNCSLNFMYGQLKGKKIDTFFGPCTFGEIAYQFLSQTLVYVIVT